MKKKRWKDQMRGIKTVDQVNVRTRGDWRGRDRIRGLQTIEQVLVLSGDRQRRWERKVRSDVFKQLTKFTYSSTYELEKNEADEMG